MNSKISFDGLPNEKQEMFFQSRTKYTAYGGSRGGGKSWAVRRKLVMMSFRYSGLSSLIIRRTLPELRENHVKPLRAELLASNAVTFNETHKCFYFKNGSVISLGYCDSEGDVLRYQGQEYDVIALDEATQLTEYQFNIFKACLRGANQFPKRIYITCNPGGVGHSWVKRLFIDKEYRDGENMDEYKFIPASVYDNKILLENNPDYLNQLESLPHDLREAWLYGKWDIFAGQYFKEFEHGLHTVEPINPDEKAIHYVAMDYGLDMFAALFIAIGKNGTAYVYDEIHEPELIVSEAAGRITAKVKENGFKINTYLAPPDLWSRQKDSGKSINELFAENGVYLTRTSSGREEGWLALKEWIKPCEAENEQGEIKRYSKMTISRRCTHLIKYLPLLMHDNENLTDVSTKPHHITHAPDALRYFAVYKNAVGTGGKSEQSTRLVPLGKKKNKHEYNQREFLI